MKPLDPPPRDAPRHHPPRRSGTPKSANDLSRTSSKRSIQKEDLLIDTSKPKQISDPPEDNEMRKPRSPFSPQSELSPTSTSSKATARSKKILVIDPKTKKKYPLNTDDHSLTDKELLVFHRGANDKLSYGKQKKKQTPSNSVSGSFFTNDQNSLSGQTLSTASALTEAEHYGGRYMYGSCHMQSCALVEETREDELTVRGEENEREGGEPTPTSATLSPLAALTSLASPLNKIRLASPLSAVQSFFPRFINEDIRCKRIGMVIFPHYFGSSGLESRGYDCAGLRDGAAGDGTLMGIRLKQCPIDFMAHVCFVQRESLAEKMGVEKGDVVTFAISLSNMASHDPENTHLAEKLIKRLESVGMRTSYRELFDIFLSETTNTRPVGIVFRRFRSKPWGGGIVNPASPKSLSPRSVPDGESLTITDEFDWSTDFLRSLSIKCREYEFERVVPLRTNQIIENDASVLSFLPPPNSTMVSTKNVEVEEPSGPANQLSTLLDLAGRYSCAAANCGIGASAEKRKVITNGANVEMNKLFLSNRTLSSLMEQAVGLIFLHRCVDVSYSGGVDGSASIKNATCSGSGFVVVRKTEGEWSAPCFLEVLGSKSPSDEAAESSFESVHMVIINKKELAGRLILGNTVKFSVSKKQQRVNVLVRDAAFIANNGGRFELMDEFFAAVKVSEEQNEAFYSAMTPMMKITPKDVLVGTLSPPEQSIDFYGALQSLELPYSMHAHPVIPELIQAYCTSDWTDIVPTCSRNKSSSASVSSAIGGGMRTILKLVAKGDSISDKREIDVFARRFQYYLIDGVPVQVVLPANGSLREDKILRLTIRESSAFSEALLELSRKRRPGIMNVGMQGNSVTTMEAITKLSRTPPATLELDEEEKRRFFSFETDLSSGPIMMLAKSKKDAMLLLCGLKLLLEREKMHHR